MCPPRLQPASAAVLLAALALACLSAAQEPPLLALKPVVLQQLHAPTTITHAPDGSGRLFVTDQPGRIFIIQNSMMLPQPFLDMSEDMIDLSDDGQSFVPLVGMGYTERGLLGLAFHPGYADPESPGYRRFYINHTAPKFHPTMHPSPENGPVNCVTVIAEYQTSDHDPNQADPDSKRILLTFAQPQSNHNGGHIEFGPDGMLYIGSGDGGGSNDNRAGHTGGGVPPGSPDGTPLPTDNLGNSLDKTNLLGKILRINPLDPDGDAPLTYSVPPDNPFADDDSPPGLKKEIFAYGLRNPWKFSFDSRPGGSGRLFCPDVGQGRVEEVNLIIPGGNYGWRYLEGTEMPLFSSANPDNPMPHPGGVLLPPIAEYAHPGATVGSPPLPQLGLSITGGHVYRGGAIPGLQGFYIFGDYGATGGAPAGRLMALREDSPGEFTLIEAMPLLGGNPFSQRLLTFGENAEGEIFLGVKTSGGVMATEHGLPNGGIYQLVAASSLPGVITLAPSRDASIFGETEAGGPALANGAGPLFAGPVNGTQRRALLAFDFSSIHPATRFTIATLQLHISAVGPGALSQRTTALHRVNHDWTEGPSTSPTGPVAAESGDVTWSHRSFQATSPPLWTSEGGDFDTAHSANLAFRSPGSFGWVNARLAADATAWLQQPASNHGWIIRSDEAAAAPANVLKTIASREHATAALRPKLILVPGASWQQWLATHFPSLLVGQFKDWSEDTDQDGIADLLEFAHGTDPLVRNTDSPFTVSADGPDGLLIQLRWNPAAAEASLMVQASHDLDQWVSILRIDPGGQPIAENGATLDPPPPSETIQQLLLRYPHAPGARVFTRLVANLHP